MDQSPIITDNIEHTYRKTKGFINPPRRYGRPWVYCGDNKSKQWAYHNMGMNQRPEPWMSFPRWNKVNYRAISAGPRSSGIKSIRTQKQRIQRIYMRRAHRLVQRHSQPDQTREIGLFRLFLRSTHHQHEKTLEIACVKPTAILQKPDMLYKGESRCILLTFEHVAALVCAADRLQDLELRPLDHRWPPH